MGGAQALPVDAALTANTNFLSRRHKADTH
jgi:hypothetical protein